MRTKSKAVLAALLTSMLLFAETELLLAFAQMKGDAPTPKIKIVDKPIVFDQERKELTLAYRREHQDPDAKDISIAPKMIILHHTAINSFDATWKYFNRVRAETARTQLASAGDVNVSAQFVVDRDGTIYRLMPETMMARHCIGLNHLAIGIENVGDGKGFPLTDAQVEADAALVRYLKAKYDGIEYLIGHNEYREMEGTPLFLERDPKYRNQKPDPGQAFMEKVRERVKELGLKGTAGKKAFINNGTVGEGLYRGRQTIRFTGKVQAGNTYVHYLGNGLAFWLTKGSEGWVIEVCDRSETPCVSDYVWPVNMPYRSSNSRYLDTSYGFTPEEAVRWSPRTFNFVTNQKSYLRARYLVDRLIMSKPQGETYTTEDSAKDFIELKALIAEGGTGDLYVVDSRIREGRIAALEFRVELRLPCSFEIEAKKSSGSNDAIPCGEPPAKASELKSLRQPIVRPF